MTDTNDTESSLSSVPEDYGCPQWLTAIDKTFQNEHNFILYYWLIDGKSQQQIADIMGTTRANINNKLKRIRHTPKFTELCVKLWDQSASLQARRKALLLLNSIDINKIPDSYKAQSASILIDKARLIDGQTSGNQDGQGLTLTLNFGNDKQQSVQVSGKQDNNNNDIIDIGVQHDDNQ